MKTSTTMIMSGYGWGDAAMNGRIDNWLINHGERLILLHKTPDVLKDASIFLDGLWDYLLATDKLGLIEKWLMDAKMDELGL